MKESAKTFQVITTRDVLIVLVVYLAALMMVAGVPHPQNGFPLDDSWIHQVVARNLAHDGTLGFIPRVRSSGSSSLLWTFLLAANWKFLPGVSPVLYSAFVSAVLFVVAGCGLLAMARKDGMSKTACWILALSPALDGNFMWLGMIGMEHLLFTTLSIAGVYLWFQRSERSAITAALCLGALSLTRPEGVILAVLLVIAKRWTLRSRKDSVVLTGVVAFCVGCSLVANYVTSNSWLPTTYAGRKWLYFGSEKIPLLTHGIFPLTLFRSLLQPWAVHQTHILYIVNVLIALLMILGVWVVFAGGRTRTGFLTIWGFVHIVIYMVMLPTRSHGGRYQPLFLALSFSFMFLGIQVLTRHSVKQLRLLSEHSEAVMPTVTLICILIGAFSLGAWRKVTRTGINLIEGTHAKMGNFLVSNLPEQSKVAALDIGRIGFIFGGSLRDMGGLTDSAFLPYMRNHEVFNYLREQKVEFLVWPTDELGTLDIPQILSFTPEDTSSLSKLARFCVPRDLWYASYSVTLDAAPCQTLFRLQWTPKQQN